MVVKACSLDVGFPRTGPKGNGLCKLEPIKLNELSEHGAVATLLSQLLQLISPPFLNFLIFIVDIGISDYCE